MKNHKYIILSLAICSSFLFSRCSNDVDGKVIIQETCNDGIQNNGETSVDCGGPACAPCNESFSGTFVQQDILGRPGINKIFGANDGRKNDFNVSVVNQRQSFQPEFQNKLETYHDIYGNALGLNLDYENNILGLDATTFTRLLAEYDALQVAPNGETTYYDSATGVALTGRRLQDDAIDFSLTLMFGGMTGTRFDGNNGTPQLTSDGVDFGDRVVQPFPYLQAPL